MELMVVLVILGLAASLVVPRFAAASSRAALKGGTRDVITTLGYARNQASAEGRTYRVQFDPSSAEFSLTRFDPDADSEDAYVPFTGILGETQMLPEGVSFRRVAVGEDAGGVEAPGSARAVDSSGAVYVRFYADGTTDQAVIITTTEDGEELTVVLDQFTGRARVLEPEEAQELQDDLGLK